MMDWEQLGSGVIIGIAVILIWNIGLLVYRFLSKKIEKSIRKYFSKFYDSVFIEAAKKNSSVINLLHTKMTLSVFIMACGLFFGTVFGAISDSERKFDPQLNQIEKMETEKPKANNEVQFVLKAVKRIKILSFFISLTLIVYVFYLSKLIIKFDLANVKIVEHQRCLAIIRPSVSQGFINQIEKDWVLMKTHHDWQKIQAKLCLQCEFKGGGNDSC